MSISATHAVVNRGAHGVSADYPLASLIVDKSPIRDGLRQSKPTQADLEAAERLRAAWAGRPKGLTQERMGDILGISQGAVSQYINGRIPLNYRTVVGFARELGIAPEVIRNDLPEMAGGMLGPLTGSGRIVVAEPRPTYEPASHSVREQRLTMRATARILEKAREFIIGQVDEDLLIDNAIDAANEVGPQSVIDGDGLDEALRIVAARMRTG